MEQTEETLQVFKAIREVAARLAVSSKAYADIIVDIEDPAKREDARKRALALSLSIAPVQVIALESLQYFKARIDKPYHPPVPALMALGSIALSCQLLAATGPEENLDDVPLLSLVTLQQILSATVIKNWMFTCLGAGQ